jgi:hypothetical protein
MTLVVFPSKPIGETAPYVFDFSDKLQFGEAITGGSVAVVVASGTDSNPSAMVSGSPVLTATTVMQDLTGGIAGVIYAVACTVTATGSHNYVKQGSLAVINDTGNYVAA